MIYEDNTYKVIGKTPDTGFEVAYVTYTLTHLDVNLEGSYIAINQKVLSPINVDKIETIIMRDVKYINFVIAALTAQNRINARIVELGVFGDPLISMLLNDTINAIIDDLSVIIEKVVITEAERARQSQDCYRRFLGLIAVQEKMLNIVT